ncbi:MAG TPA: hypothetical protein VGG41_16235 [Solirubrobacteraceae bacterium]
MPERGEGKPDRHPVAYDQHGPRASCDVAKSCHHALGLRFEGLAAREREVGIDAVEGGQGVRVLGLDLRLETIGPVAAIRLHEPLIQARIKADARPDDLRGLQRTQQRARPEFDKAHAGRSLRQQLRLSAAGCVDRYGEAALEAVCGVVVGLAVASEEHFL